MISSEGEELDSYTDPLYDINAGEEEEDFPGGDE
jgi:hypothetical protein